LSGLANTHANYLTKSINIYLSCKVNPSETMSIRGCKCSGRTLRNETCAKIRLSEKVSIPAASEMFVEGYVNGKLKVDFGLVESTRYMQSKGLSIRGCKCSGRTLGLGVVLSPCTSSMTSTLLNTPITLFGPNFIPF
jgi:hypothetical protein